MFASFAPLALFALALSSSVSAAPIPKRNVEVRAAPSGWAHGYLEDYDVYHTRYVALSCQTQHDTTFFDECCHPLLSTETLSGNRPAQCTPSASTSAVAIETFAPSTTAAAAAPAATSAASGEEEECEVEEETSSVAVPTSTVEAESPATTQEATTTVAEVAAAVVAPTTTAEAWVAPTTTTAEAAAATTAAASSSSENTGGYATYFLQNGNPGACGNYNSDDTPLVAITSEWWGGDNFSSGSDLCGKYVNIKRVSTGATVTAVIADACPSCVNGNSLDLSVGAFTALGQESEGMFEIEWSLV
ncbi:RlpA-like double-psi beta-barrel-protein domain-containing protein-containing protein [Mrakia frigida]|uniref:RlpA-like double-psi beta-barrel domain-containing protein n=1 Tax=Mrakia frigida TaxID=29902 RepID=UPI003FCBFD4A